MTDKTTDVIVTQAIRDAAANAVIEMSDRTMEIRMGDMDHSAVVQAFARHRISHSLPGDGPLANELRDAFPAGDKLGVRLSAHMFGRILAALAQPEAGGEHG